MTASSPTPSGAEAAGPRRCWPRWKRSAARLVEVPEPERQVVDDERGQHRRPLAVDGDEGVGPRAGGLGQRDLPGGVGPPEGHHAEPLPAQRLGLGQLPGQRGAEHGPDADQLPSLVDGVLGQRQRPEALARRRVERVAGAAAGHQGPERGGGDAGPEAVAARGDGAHPALQRRYKYVSQPTTSSSQKEMIRYMRTAATVATRPPP